MLKELENLATFEVRIGGVAFVQRRRTTLLMLEIGDVRRVFGLVAGANALDPEKPETVEALAVAAQDLADMTVKGCRVALVSVAGVPTDTEGFNWDAVAPVADVLFDAFLKSGLSVDPTPDSCEGAPESS